MKTIATELEINAPADKVWSILCDFAAYPSWNPFITRIQGDQEVGARLDVTLRPPGARGITLRPRVLAMEPARELRWLGRLLVRGIFDGEHRFTLEALGPGRTLLRQEERFTGLLPPLLPGTLRQTEQGFLAMNQALKERAERPAA